MIRKLLVTEQAMLKNHLLYFLVLIVTTGPAFSQDSLIFKNDNFVVGEIKNMDRGVLTIETDYSDSDFTVKWNEVKKIFTKTHFLVTLANGDRITGSLTSTDSANVIVHADDGASYLHPLHDLVIMKSLSNRFWDQVQAEISAGYSLTRAQMLQQFSMRSNAAYLVERWSLEASFNTVNSKQDEVEDIQRKDAALTFYYFLPKDWYIPVSVTLLSNTEQKIDMRLLGKVGFGKYVVHTNETYWGFSAGANVNYEDFAEETEVRTSWEAFVGTELNLFDIGDLSLKTRLVGYPSLTESGRMRADFSFDVKYDLPYDFYIQLGYTLNYDNNPVEGVPEGDYVFQTTFGWSWD